jgi:hypothetical protein
MSVIEPVVTEENGTIIDNRVFPAFADLLDTVECLPVAWECSELSSDKRDRLDFTQTESLEHAMQIARNGWPEGLERLNKTVQSTADFAVRAAPAPAIGYDVAGFAPDVAEFLTGNPDCMLTVGSQLIAAAPIVDIKVNTFMSCQFSDTEVANRGAAILSLIEYLTDSGAECELTLLNVAKSSRGSRLSDPGAESRYSTVVKRAGEHVERDRLAFMLMHPSMFRRLTFRLYEQCSAIEDNFSWCYGLPHDWTRPNGDNSIYVPNMSAHDRHCNFNTPQGSLKAIAGLVAKHLPADMADMFKQDWAEYL